MMFVTAYGALIELGQLGRGDAVLIGAASGRRRSPGSRPAR
nr:hypothetical protein [Burkholderia sp. CpTa8-5]